MTYEHQMWLLDMVGKLRLHPRLAKIKAKTPEQEWEMLERLVKFELDKAEDEK